MRSLLSCISREWGERERETVPRRSLPSRAAGPSSKISFIWRKCSPFSFPPMMVKPKPFWLFCNDDVINSPDRCGDDGLELSWCMGRASNREETFSFFFFFAYSIGSARIADVIFSVRAHFSDFKHYSLSLLAQWLLFVLLKYF